MGSRQVASKLSRVWWRLDWNVLPQGTIMIEGYGEVVVEDKGGGGGGLREIGLIFTWRSHEED